MLTLTVDDIVEARDWTLETDNDYQREVLFARDGRNYRVTVFARADYGPSSFTYAIDDDDTGDYLFDSRVNGLAPGIEIRVNLALIGQLSRELYESVTGEDA